MSLEDQMPKLSKNARSTRLHVTSTLLLLGLLATVLWPFATTEQTALDDTTESMAHAVPHSLLPPSHLLMDVHHMLTLMGR